MKRIAILTGILVLLTGCFPDDRNNFMVEDSFGISSQNGIIDASVHTGIAMVGVTKSGKGLSSGKVHLIKDADVYLPLLDQYNARNKTSFKPVMGSLLEYKVSELNFSAEDVVKSLCFTWDPALMTSFIGSDPNYVIPVLVESEDLKMNDGRAFAMVRLTRTKVSIKQALQARTILRKRVENVADPDQLKETLKLDLSLSSPIKGATINFTLKEDPCLLASYNTGKEEPFTLAPEGLITLTQPSFSVESGRQGGTFQIVLDKSLLLENGKMKDFPPYALPVSLDAENIKAKVGGEETSLQGLQFGNTTTYITVSRAKKGISVVLREWGYYSPAEDKPWYENIEGFKAGADRSIAMDDEYLYLAHSNGTPAIYALKLSDGEVEKTLELGDKVKGNGCTFPVSCVRMIPGKEQDVLTFCSLKGADAEHLYVYAYSDGLDKAPVQILDYIHDNKGGADDFRRYGDRYTVKGTWEDGELWFHTWNADNPDGAKRGKTVVFTLQNGVVTNPKDPKSYLLDGTSGDDGVAIRDIALYPGWEDHALVTRHDAAGIFQKTAEQDKNVPGWIQWNKTLDMPSQALSLGYNFFEFHEQNFIAYVQLDKAGAQSGKLVIIQDDSAAPADFPTQLLTPSKMWTFPLQGDEESSISAIKAVSSVGDCAVREIGDNTYVATLLQGGGLCLFMLQ